MANRTTVIGGIWAKNAPDPPSGTVPSAGTTYADSGTDEPTIETGWPYSTIVDSSTHNELMRRLTTLIRMLEDQGILTWCASTTYGAGAKVLGSDGFLYHSILGTNLNHDPISSPTYWVANPFYAVATGPANAYVANLVPGPTILSPGVQAWIKIDTPNTGASTLNLNGTGVTAITWPDGSATQAGMLSGVVCVVYDGTKFILESAGVYPQQVQNNVFAYSTDVSMDASTVYSATYSPTILALVDGMILSFLASNRNPGAAFFSPDGLTIKPIWTPSHEILVGGTIVANGDVTLMYNETAGAWILLHSTGSLSGTINLPIYPEINTTLTKLTLTKSTGQVIVDPAQEFVLRGTQIFNTSDFPSASRTFALSSSHTYHLRFVGRTAGVGMGSAFYASRGITDNTFYIASLASADYNPTSLAETDSAFDTKYDDMLIAKVTTDGSNVVTSVSLVNLNVLRKQSADSDAAYHNPTWVALVTVALNWSRTPIIHALSVNGVQTWPGTFGDGTLWSSVASHGTMGQFAVGEVADPTRYGGSLQYCYQDSYKNDGQISWVWALEA